MLLHASPCPDGELLELGGVLVAAPAVDAGEIERKRAEERAKLEAEAQRARGKLGNEGFVAKASKIGELYADLAKESYKPFETIIAKAK